MRSPNAIPDTPMRRRIASIAHALAVLAIVGLVLVGIGTLLTDRFHWSQYLFWIPTLPACLLAAILLATSWTFMRPRYRGKWVRRTGWLLVVATLLVSTQFEWGGGTTPPVPPREQRLRVVFWNFSESGEPGWESPAIEQDPDLVVVRGGECTQPAGVRERMGEHAFFCWDEGFMVTSKVPIKAWGSGSLNIDQGLGLDPREADLIRKGRDPGRAMWLLLGTRERLGMDVVVWLVDLPSDLSLWRASMMEQAFVTMVQGPAKRWVPKDAADGKQDWREASDAEVPATAFQLPNLIVGDFNTPHRAHSLSILTQNFESAYDQAGLGYSATFPRDWPLWQLDQAFIAPPLRACTHEIVDTARGSHRMLVFDVENPRVNAP
jgi:hypothetical protein